MQLQAVLQRSAQYAKTRHCWQVSFVAVSGIVYADVTSILHFLVRQLRLVVVLILVFATVRRGRFFAGRGRSRACIQTQGLHRRA